LSQLYAIVSKVGAAAATGGPSQAAARPFTGISQAHRRVEAIGLRLLFSAGGVVRSPALRASWRDEQIKAVRVGQLVGLLARFSSVNSFNGEGHGIDSKTP